MNTGQGFDLSRHTTFGVAARAESVIRIESATSLAGVRFDPRRDLVLGGGSNLLLAEPLRGTVLLNRIRARKWLRRDSRGALLEAGAGEPWHELVRWTLAEGFGGLENLSLIPGLAGAAPIQNIGAYGVELADCLHSLTAWDFEQARLREFGPEECGFSYRESRFKSTDRDRFLITAIRLRLERSPKPRLEYPGLLEELEAQGGSPPSPMAISDAVIRLRRRKLPDPALQGNAGSFFKNPVVERVTAKRLENAFPHLPQYPAPGGRRKLSAAWMIEHRGWKGTREGDAGVSRQHALVLVNHGQASAAQLLALAARITADVASAFGVVLEPEPRIVPDSAWPAAHQNPG